MLCVFNSFAELGPIKLKHKRVSREDLDNFKGFKAFCRLLVMGKKRMRVVKYCKPLKNFLIVILDYNLTSEFSHVCVSLYLYEREIHWSHLNSDIESINASLSISMAKQVLLDSYALYQCKVSKPHFSNNPMMALIQEGRGFQQTWLFPVRQLRHKQNSGGWRQIGTCGIGCRGWSWAGEPQQHFIPWVLYCHLLGLKTNTQAEIRLLQRSTLRGILLLVVGLTVLKPISGTDTLNATPSTKRSLCGAQCNPCVPVHMSSVTLCCIHEYVGWHPKLVLLNVFSLLSHLISQHVDNTSIKRPLLLDKNHK